MKITFLLILSFLVTNNVFGQTSSQSFNPRVSVFGEGTISTKEFEFNAAFTPDRKTVYYSKALLPDWRRISIVYSTFNGKGWSKAKLAYFSGQYRDADPFISPDGKRLIFISDRPSPVKSKPTDYSFWYIDLEKRGEPILLEGEFYKKTPNPLYPSVAKNGNLYYCANANRDSELYLSRWRNGHYVEPEKLPFNSPAQVDLDPIVSPNEDFLIFVSPTRKGAGGSDLWVSFNENGTWSEPINLGSTINSLGNDGQPGLSPDGKKLYFTSVRPKESSNYAPRGRRINQSEFDGEFQNIFNGLPNIWEADISQIYQLKAVKP